MKHIASTSPNLDILHYLLSQGGSVHVRNRSGRTPLFLAANAGLSGHVFFLRKSGAHLHSDERSAAELLARRKPGIWGLAGVGPLEISEKEMEEEEKSGDGRKRVEQKTMAGSAPS